MATTKAKTRAKATTVKTAPIGKSPAKAAPAKKVVAKKAAPAKKVVAKKAAPAKKAPAKKVVAKKAAPAKKAPAKKVAGKPLPASKKAAPAKTGWLSQRVSLPAPPARIYEAILDGEQHSAFTNAPAHVEPWVGGKFNAWDGYIHGVVMELEAGRRIVQSWRASDFPSGHPTSRLEMTMTDDGKGGTVLEVDHRGLPPHMVADYDRGWHDFYWSPLREWLTGAR